MGNCIRRFAAKLTATRSLAMNEEALNLSIRKFLKMVGVSSQREIEHAVAKALADGAVAGTDTFPARVTLEIGRLNLQVHFDGEIRLQ
jgi:hypothetical protein